MIVGGYSLHLYCDGPRHAELYPGKVKSLDADIAGRDLRDCLKQARNLGWRINLYSSPQKAICPVCLLDGAKWK